MADKPIGETKYIEKTTLHNPEVKSKYKNACWAYIPYKTQLTADFGQIWVPEN